MTYGGAGAITPDLVNGAVYDSTYIAPKCFLNNEAVAEEDTEDPPNFQWDPGESDINGNGLMDTHRDPYQVYLNGALPPTASAVYIDDWYYHINEGEVHCSSNERREKPATTNPGDSWWNKVEPQP
jgi:hypothetical protein